MRPLLLATLLAACSNAPTSYTSVILVGGADDASLLSDFTRTMDTTRVGPETVSDPTNPGRRDRAITLALVSDEALCAQCYTIAQDGDVISVSGGGVLGRLYGASHVLESIGFRFPHPQHTFVPDTIELPQDLPASDVVHAPEVAGRRGIHLHTLHPIEGMFDAWMPSEEGADRMAAVADWVVRNRGTHLQWVALDDILGPDGTHAAWKEHTITLLDRIHEVGLTAGLGIQLFGSGNLQQAFDLVDEGGTIEDQKAEMGPRLDKITDGLDFDLVNLSFGEFFGEDPDAFISSVELVYDELQARQPGIEMTTVIHVGDDQQVTYEGKEQIYYFLATYADRDITHWVHTVMYYDLFGDAGGAYHHDEFDQHRDYLQSQLKAGDKVGYFPESAYWIAFDNSVPRYLPYYQKARWLDLDGIGAYASQEGVAGLQDHVLFSSGWEWGYWAHDVSFLRHSWKKDDDWCAPQRDQFSVYGTPGSLLADAVCELGELQQVALVEQRLTPYLASFDATMVAGFGVGVVAAPKRPYFRDVATSVGPEREAYRVDVVNLDAYADGIEALVRRTEDIEVTDQPLLAEAQQGLQLAAVRARFAYRLALAAVRAADRDEAGIPLDNAEDLLEEGRMLIEQRHAALYDPDPERLTEARDNPTIYNFGYLKRANDLCYWTRELRLARNDLLGTTFDVPSCALEATDP